MSMDGVKTFSVQLQEIREIQELREHQPLQQQEQQQEIQGFTILARINRARSKT